MNSQPSSSPSVSVKKPGLRPYLPLILALSLGAGAEAFTSSAVSVALPRIAGGFAASPDEISWAVTLYLAGNAIGLPLTAWFSDTLGQRRYLGLSMIAYLLTSLGCLLSPSLPVFLVMRTLEGAAGASFVARALFTFTKEFRPPVFAKALFIFIGSFSLRALGLPFGGYLVDHLSWRCLFVVPIVLMGLGALPALALSDEIWPRRERPAPDFIGLVLLVTGLGSLLVLLNRGQRDDWLASPVILALLAIITLTIPLFLWWENHSANRNPLLSFASLHYRGMGVGVTLSFLAGVMMVGGLYVLPQFLLRIVGCDACRTGWLMSIDAFSVTAGLAIAVIILGRFPTRFLLTLSGLSFASAMVLLAFRITSATPVEALYLPLMLHGLAIGFALPPIGIFSFRAIGPNAIHNSEGRAWHYTARALGGAVSVTCVVLMLDVRATIHSSRLAENLVDVRPIIHQTIASIGSGLASHGLPPSFTHQAAGLVISRLVTREATVLAFHDLFLASTAIGLLVSALSFGFPKARLSQTAVTPTRATPDPIR